MAAIGSYKESEIHTSTRETRNITKGLAVSGNNPNSGIPNTTFFSDNIDGPNATGFDNYLRDVHAYTSASSITRTALAVVADGTVSGGGTIQNVAMECSANGTNAFAIEVTSGSVYIGLGTPAPHVWLNSPDTETSNLLAVGGKCWESAAHRNSLAR